MSIEYGGGDTKFMCDGEGCDAVAYVAPGEGMPAGWKCGGPIEEIGEERHFCPRCGVGVKTCEACGG